jgi:hypothetical protein
MVVKVIGENREDVYECDSASIDRRRGEKPTDWLVKMETNHGDPIAIRERVAWVDRTKENLYFFTAEGKSIAAY